MTIIPYEVAVPGRLADEFGRGFTGMSFERFGHQPVALTVSLWHADGTGLRINSQMHDLAERTEVGALVFSSANRTGSESPSWNLLDEFAAGPTAWKLVVSESGFNVESGVVLRGRQGGEIIIVAASYPYKIAVKAPFISEPFQPEYELSTYSRELIV